MAKNYKSKNKALTIALAVMAVLLVLVTVFLATTKGGTDYSLYKPDNPDTIKIVDGNGNDMTAPGVVYDMPAQIYLSGGTTDNDVAVDLSWTMQATITPDTAVNKAVDWSIAWADGATRASKDVTDYMTVTPSADGSATATVNVTKSFGGDAIIITVKTRSGGYTATCTVTYTDAPAKIEVTSSATQRDGVYQLMSGDSHTFGLKLVDAAGTTYDDYKYSVSAEFYGMINITDGKEVTEDKLMYIADIDDFVSATVSGDNANVTVPQVYESYIYSGGYKFASYQNEHPYIELTVTESNSGLTTVIKLNAYTDITGVSLNHDEIDAPNNVPSADYNPTPLVEGSTVNSIYIDFTASPDLKALNGCTLSLGNSGYITVSDMQNGGYCLWISNKDTGVDTIFYATEADEFNNMACVAGWQNIGINGLILSGDITIDHLSYNAIFDALFSSTPFGAYTPEA